MLIPLLLKGILKDCLRSYCVPLKCASFTVSYNKLWTGVLSMVRDAIDQLNLTWSLDFLLGPK